MSKKSPENKYGVCVGDIFVHQHNSEDYSRCYFYQVVNLRGATQVVLREISSKIIGVDDNHEVCKPIKDAWVKDEELIKRVSVYEDSGKIFIMIDRFTYAYPYNKRKRYINSGTIFSWRFFQSRLLKGVECDVNKNSGVYFKESVSVGVFREREVEIRYPNGSKEKAYYNDAILMGKRTIKENGRIIHYIFEKGLIEDAQSYTIASFKTNEQGRSIRMKITCNADIQNGETQIVIGLDEDKYEKISLQTGGTTKVVEVDCEKGYVVTGGGRCIGSIELEIEHIG